MNKQEFNKNILLIGDICIYNQKKDGYIKNAYPVYDGEHVTILGFATIKGGAYAIYSRRQTSSLQIGIALEKAFKKIEDNEDNS